MSRQRRRGGIVWGTLIGLALLAGGAPQASAELKIGFIDSDQIFANYSKTKEAQVSFEREVVDLSKTARDKKSEIDDMQRKLDQQSPMLSEAKRDEQNRILQQKVAEYDKFVQEQWGPGGRISRLNEEYLKPIIDRVHAIVAFIGTDEGYSLILDAADGNVIYGDKSLDLTDRVLSELKTEDETGIPSGSKKP